MPISYQMTCPVCGDTFTATRSDARYCSNTCRQKSHRRQVRYTRLVEASIRALGGRPGPDGHPLCSACGERPARGRGSTWRLRPDLCWRCAHTIEKAHIKALRLERNTRTCEDCGTVFRPERSDTRYCSSACRQRNYRERKITGEPAPGKVPKPVDGRVPWRTFRAARERVTTLSRLERTTWTSWGAVALMIAPEDVDQRIAVKRLRKFVNEMYILGVVDWSHKRDVLAKLVSGRKVVLADRQRAATEPT
jgi:predicted nucleic acid-binding Zn ribbon protein